MQVRQQIWGWQFFIAFQLTQLFTYKKLMSKQHIMSKHSGFILFFNSTLHIVILTEVKIFIIICPCWKSELTIFNYLIILLPNSKILNSLFFPSKFFIKNILYFSSAATLCKMCSSDLAIWTSLRYFWPVSFHSYYEKKMGRGLHLLNASPPTAPLLTCLVSFSCWNRRYVKFITKR